jgi:hypothetical protein
MKTAVASINTYGRYQGGDAADNTIVDGKTATYDVAIKDYPICLVIQ